jgi:uncharacterized protein (TIGR03663 family)
VSTRSTKSKHNSNKARSEFNPSVERIEGELPDRVWRIGAIVVLGIAAVLRFYDLALVPFHHDEGVNGNFLVRLVREGYYQYDPANYHGPTLYYFTAIIAWIIRLLFGMNAADTYGLNTITIRLVTALFGLGSIGLMFLLRRRLGTVATLAAGLLLAVSPGAVYLSRYYIHESLFVFFTLGIVVAGIKFYDERNLIYLLLASISAALMFATKETAMISAAVLLIAFGVTHAYLRLFGSAALGRRAAKARLDYGAVQVRQFYESIGGSTGILIGVALSLVLFLLVNVIFYSSFFTNFPKGVYDSVKTFAIWTNTGNKDHVHPPLTYFFWLIRQESPLLFLGAIGAVLTVFKPKNTFALFVALWSFGLIAAYSLVPYKTPWLVLNFIVPLSLIAGYAIQAIYELDWRKFRFPVLMIVGLWSLGLIRAYLSAPSETQWLLLNLMMPLSLIAGYAIQAIYELDREQLRLPVLVMVAALGISTYQAIDLNFFNYDNDAQKYVYVYAHTKRPTLQLLKEIDKAAAQAGGYQAGITIVSPDYWPLPWYLRDYKRVGYYGRMSPSSEPIIIASETQKAEMSTQFGDRYRLVPSAEPGGGYELRPGVSLLLYVRNNGAPAMPVPTP